MKFVVVSTNASDGDFFGRRILPTPRRIARSADRVYRFYQTDIEQGFSFADLDGEPLVEVHAFETLADASDWVTEDARQRRALFSAGGRTQ